MQNVFVSFERQNLRTASHGWVFRSRHVMRFEWVALLALRRATVPPDQAWVSIQEIARLPHWGGKDVHHVGTNIGRYLQELERKNLSLVAARSRWSGPYCLIPPPLAIRFDIPLSEVINRLWLRRRKTGVHSEKLFLFTAKYVRSQWLLFQGKLFSTRKEPVSENAYQLLMELAGEKRFSPAFRLVARLGAVQVLFRLGQFGAARKTLLDSLPYVRRTQDRSLKAQFYLALAWSYQRASSGNVSDRTVKETLGNAATYAQDSGDRSALGLLAYRTGLYLTKQSQHMEAVAQLQIALEAFLITGNYDSVQATCVNIGSVIHRLGPAHYEDARRWLLLGIAIARWMRLGREDAHGEMILGKIYTERGTPGKASSFLRLAERIAQRADNQLN